jgi:hypothetical protein
LTKTGRRFIILAHQRERLPVPARSLTVPQGLKTRVASVVNGVSQDGTIVVVCEGLVDVQELTHALQGLYERLTAAGGVQRPITFTASDPSALQGLPRRKFEDGCFERSRITNTPVHVYVAEQKFYVIPSIRDTITWVDPKGKPLQ